MQKIKFINRVKELNFLQEMYNKGSGLVIIYGRRRIGKTELLKQFISNKPHLYYLADKRGTEINARNMARLAAETFNELPVVVENFDNVFRFITKKCQEKFIIVIDEFSYLIEKDSAIPSIFQLITDEIIKEKAILLILCGSSISMMYNGILSYKSPLYGRRLGEWKVTPLDFRDVIKFFPDADFEKAIELYAIFGNIPAYLTAVESSKTLQENIIDNILKKGSRLYREPEFLLKEELREPSRYISILEALSQSTKLSEIASKADVPAKDMPKYFDVLFELELIKKEIPITEKKGKNTHYYITDNLFYFYFKHAYPYISLLEEGREEEVYLKMESSLQWLYSKAFEDIVRENIGVFLNFQAEKIGRWWGYHRENEKRIEEEIDVIVLNEMEAKIALIECKYSYLNYRQASQILKDVERKIELVNWNNRKGTEFLGIAAKKIEEKEKLREKDFIAVDFEDLISLKSHI